MCVATVEASAQVRPGLEVALTDSLHLLQGKRIGLITNRTGADRGGKRNIDLLYHASGVKLVSLFGPEHGIATAAAAGEKIASSVDSATGLPVNSLYGATRIPTDSMLRDVDVLVYDIQDVGARVYTYEWTMALAAEAAGRLGKKFVVLDRPDPIRADVVQGGVLKNEFRSFVGQFDVALRYGLTPGELLRFLVGTGRIKADVTVIPMSGYRRSMWYTQTGLPWLDPSPNIRDEEAATLYPGTVFFEATNLSEGRGTDAPLKQVGAPWLTDAQAIAREMNGMRLKGVRFEAREVEVASGEKHGGRRIPVVRLYVTDRNAVEPVAASVWLMRVIRRRHTKDFAWQKGNGLERLSGSASLRKAVERGGVTELLDRWAKESRAFKAATKPYWLYPE